MNKKRVLFFCIHNSARSQIAQAWLNHIGSDRFEVESAGLEPTTVKPHAIAIMREVGIDISENRTQSVFDVFKSGRLFHYVIALCDEVNAKRCPPFPGVLKFLHWDFPERPKLTSAEEDQLTHFRNVRALIKDRVAVWIAENP